MGVLAFLLAIICLLLVLVLVRYHIAVKDVAQQIRQKRQQASSIGPCSKYFRAN